MRLEESVRNRKAEARRNSDHARGLEEGVKLRDQTIKIQEEAISALQGKLTAMVNSCPEDRTSEPQYLPPRKAPPHNHVTSSSVGNPASCNGHTLSQAPGEAQTQHYSALYL